MEIIDVFKPLIGLPIWGYGYVYGSMGVVQFGKPDLFYTEYFKDNNEVESRKMDVYGQYSFYDYGLIWQIKVGEINLDWEHATKEEMIATQRKVNGQVVTHVSFEDGIISLSFDLGAVITYDLRPHSYLKNYGDDPLDHLWALDNKVDSFDYSLSKGLEIEMSSWNPDYPA
jgi:hypothetical protein